MCSLNYKILQVKNILTIFLILYSLTSFSQVKDSSYVKNTTLVNNIIKSLDSCYNAIFIDVPFEFETKIYKTKEVYSSIANCSNLQCFYINGYDILNNYDTHKDIRYEGLCIQIDIKNRQVIMRKGVIVVISYDGTISYSFLKRSEETIMQLDEDLNLVEN